MGSSSNKSSRLQVLLSRELRLKVVLEMALKDKTHGSIVSKDSFADDMQGDDMLWCIVPSQLLRIDLQLNRIRFRWKVGCYFLQ